MTKISPKITETITSGFSSGISTKFKNKNIDKAVKNALNSQKDLSSFKKIDNQKIAEATKALFLSTTDTPKGFKSMEDALLASGYSVKIDDTIANAPKTLTHSEAVAKFTKKIV